MNPQLHQNNIKSFECHRVASSTKLIKPWKVKIFRLIRYMDTAQATESNLVHGMFLVVQSLQLIYYTFEVYLAWANPNTTEYKLVTQLADVLRYLHISGFVKEAATPTPFYILFFAIMTIKCTVYSFIAQNVLRDDEKKTSDAPNVADMILRLLYIFNFYMFFIPVSDGLSTYFKCYGAGRIFPNRTYAHCQIDGSVVYLCLSVVVLIIKIIINVSHEVCDTEKRIKFSKRWSKKDNLVFIMRTFCILATIVLFNLELFGPSLTAGIFFILNALTYAVKFAYPTFYSKPASKFFLMNSFVVLWMSAWLFLTMTAGKLFHHSLISFLFGLCLILLLFVFKPVDDDLKVVLTPFEDIDSSRQLIDKLEGMLYWISVAHLSDTNRSTLEKIIAVEQEDFTLEEQFNLFVAIKARNVAKFTKLERQSLLNHVHVMYQQGLMKFNNSPDMQLSFACFLAESDNKENLALEKLISLEASTGNTNTLYVIQTLKDHILTQQRKHDAADNSWGSLVFEQIMNKRLEEKLNSLLLRATQAVCELYTLLEDEGTLIQKAKEQVLRVYKSKAKLEAFWRENSSVFSVSAELVEKLAQAYRSVYDQDHICGTRFSTQLAKRRDEKIEKFASLRIDQNRTHLSAPCMLVRVENSEFIIDDNNSAVQRLLGYSRKELVGVSLGNLIIKEQFELYRRSESNGFEQLQKNSVLVFFRHKTGFLKGVHVEHKLIRAYHEMFLLLAVQETPEVQQRSRILINLDGEIQAFDSGIYTVFPRLIKFGNHRNLKAYLKNADSLFESGSGGKHEPCYQMINDLLENDFFLKNGWRALKRRIALRMVAGDNLAKLQKLKQRDQIYSSERVLNAGDKTTRDVDVLVRMVSLGPISSQSIFCLEISMPLPALRSQTKQLPQPQTVALVQGPKKQIQPVKFERQPKIPNLADFEADIPPATCHFMYNLANEIYFMAERFIPGSTTASSPPHSPHRTKSALSKLSSASEIGAKSMRGIPETTPHDLYDIDLINQVALLIQSQINRKVEEPAKQVTIEQNWAEGIVVRRLSKIPDKFEEAELSAEEDSENVNNPVRDMAAGTKAGDRNLGMQSGARRNLNKGKQHSRSRVDIQAQIGTRYSLPILAISLSLACLSLGSVAIGTYSHINFQNLRTQVSAANHYNSLLYTVYQDLIQLTYSLKCLELMSLQIVLPPAPDLLSWRQLQLKRSAQLRDQTLSTLSSLQTDVAEGQISLWSTANQLVTGRQVVINNVSLDFAKAVQASYAHVAQLISSDWTIPDPSRAQNVQRLSIDWLPNVITLFQQDLQAKLDYFFEIPLSHNQNTWTVLLVILCAFYAFYFGVLLAVDWYTSKQLDKLLGLFYGFRGKDCKSLIKRCEKLGERIQASQFSTDEEETMSDGNDDWAAQQQENEEYVHVFRDETSAEESQPILVSGGTDRADTETSESGNPGLVATLGSRKRKVKGTLVDYLSWQNIAAAVALSALFLVKFFALFSQNQATDALSLVYRSAHELEGLHALFGLTRLSILRGSLEGAAALNEASVAQTNLSVAFPKFQKVNFEKCWLGAVSI